MLVLQGYNHLLVFDYNLSFQHMKKSTGSALNFLLNLIGELDLELDLKPDPWSI